MINGAIIVINQKQMSKDGVQRWPMNTMLRGTPVFQQQAARLEVDPNSAVLRSTPLDVPPHFDGADVWDIYLPPIRNQCNCGSCWAFASCDCLAARINIWTLNQVRVQLSVANMVLCNWGSETEYDLVQRVFTTTGATFEDLTKEIQNAVQVAGCSGETLIGAWQYLYRYGTSTEECHPYITPQGAAVQYDLCSTQPGQALPTCTQVSGENYARCLDGSPSQAYRAGGFYFVTQGADEAAIRREIWKYGPVTTGMQVYDDLFSWDGNGVYRWNGTAPLTGGHAVVITGWGELGGQKYWQVRNSWGEDWGDNGYFRIVRGENHCDLETNIVTGFPDMLLANRYLLQPRLITAEDLFLRNVWPLDVSGYDVSAVVSILQGRYAPRNIAELFPADMVPDFKTMVAGRPKTIVFPYAASRARLGLAVFTLTLGLLLLGALVAL